MKIIDGKNAVLGRLASYAAKQALQGEEVVILNCEKVIITGRKRNIRKKFEEKRRRIGSGQQGPKISRNSEMVVKRAIRGMLPHRKGSGKDALRKIKCYKDLPEKFADAKKIVSGKEKKSRFMAVKEISNTR